MSQLWDTPAFWARSEADQLLRDYPESEPRTLALSFERNAGSYDDDPEFARDIIAELHRRADAEVRHWPGPIALTLRDGQVSRPRPTTGGGQDARSQPRRTREGGIRA